MKKLKLFLAAALMLCSAGAWAQTDVTSTYLTNADFESDDAVAVHLCGYKADASKAENQYNGTNALYWAQPVTGWTSNEAADNRAAGIFAYGSDQQLRGNKQSAPATNPQGQATGKALGLFAVWTGTIQYTHEITLQAGKYSIIFTYYNQSGTTNVTNLFGFETESKNYYGSTKSFSTGSWKEETVTFTLTAETKGKVSIGYTAPNSGSGANPMLFIDCVKIEYTDPNAAAHAAALEAAKFTLNGYIKKATALNGVLANSSLADAISTAQGVYDSADDWADDYDNTVNASTTLNTAITTALSGTTSVALNNGNFDTTPNNTLNGDNSTTFGGTLSTATSNPDNTKDMSANTGDHGYLYDVTGWTQFSKFNSTAAQGTTSEYGTAMPANGWSTNSTTPPATDMFGASAGAALHLSAGWGDQGRYQQTIENLPAGRYVLYYEVINQHSNTGIASNYIGVNGAAGDFYGTTNSFVYSDLKTVEQGVWKAQAFEFDVAKTANINFSVGVTTSTAGSGNGAKLWIDNYLVYRIGDVTVTTADAEAILTQVAALDESVYNASDRSALATAKTTFEGSKTLDNYNALSAALVKAQSSVSVYQSLNIAISNVENWTSDATTVTNPIRTKYTNGEYADEVTPAGIYEEYQAAEIAALAAASATDYTSAIINPSFETGDMTGWSAESRNDTKVWPNSNRTYTTSGVDGSYLFNSWGGTAENNVYQTIKNLPAGTYTLSALLAGFNGESLVLAANANTNSVTVAGDKTTGYTVNVVFTLADAADVVIKASNTKSQDGSDASFIKADNFRLTAGDITTDDYTDLIAAITAAETKTIGFDEGEYAPYNNVAALAALKAAKAVDQSVSMSQTDLDAIVNALTSATWTVNATEVNAFYDGNFAIQPEHTTGPTALTGWNNPQGIRQLIKNTTTYPGLTSATGQAAVFAWGGTTMTYGDAEGYTLPLNAHTIYEFSFKTCGWQDGDMGYVNVDIKNASNEGLQTVATATATKRITESEPWDEFKVFFETGEAGNYKFGMWTSKHTTFTDLKLVKVTNLPLNEGEDYKPFDNITINVAMTRKVVEGYNTVCLPFDLTAEQVAAVFGENAKVYTYSENSTDPNDVTVNFNTKDGNTIEANVPVLIGGATASNEVKVISNVELKSGEAKVAGTNFDFVGTYAASTDIPAGDYFVSKGALYKSTDATTIKAFRAYLKDKTGGQSNVKMYIDGLETSISEINGETVEDGVIYNIAGQRVNKAQKGIYIQNGKKVLVK